MLPKHIRILRTNSFGKTFRKQVHNIPDFTKNNYNVQRGPYSVLQDAHIQFFKNLLGNRTVTNPSDLEKYNLDWYGLYRGASSLVLKPKTTDEVAKVLEFCNNNLLAVCPQGGNTSAVGGSVAVFDEIVLSTELMNKIIAVDETAGILTCEAGCILENIDNELATKGLMAPIDLGSKGSCHIGGNVATNAGGKRLLRYGNLHGNVLGLEVVKANGEVIDCLNTLKKNNTGFHLKNLFIGSEGTLGFITKVAIQCPSRPKSVHVALLGCSTFDKVLEILLRTKQSLGEILSAFEVMDGTSVGLLQTYASLSSPIGNHKFYILIETSGSNFQHDEEKLNSLVESTLQESLVDNGTFSSEPTKIKKIWEIRERLPEIVKHSGYSFSYDVTLPLEHYFTILDEVKAELGKYIETAMGYGHLGDGNIHLKIVAKQFDKELKDIINSFVIEKTIALKGSISAEHGMGFQKAKYLKLVNSDKSYDLMVDLKRILDPNGILNPYKVF